MSRAPYDKPSTIRPVDGEVAVVGPGPVGVSITPQAARETARRLGLAADRAEGGHASRIDPDDAEAVALWAERLGVTSEAVRNAAIAVGGDSEAVAMRLASARGAADKKGASRFAAIIDSASLSLRGALGETNHSAAPRPLMLQLRTGDMRFRRRLQPSQFPMRPSRAFLRTPAPSGVHFAGQHGTSRFQPPDASPDS